MKSYEYMDVARSLLICADDDACKGCIYEGKMEKAECMKKIRHDAADAIIAMNGGV